jgi:exopolysaccharide biosynthesis polyprenyl glycosylphosphotransferase
MPDMSWPRAEDTPAIDAGQKPRWSDRPGLLKAGVITADAIAVYAGMLAAFAWASWVHPFDDEAARSVCLLVATVSLPLWIVIFFRYRLYSARHVGGRLEEMGRLLHAALTSTVAMAGVSFFWKQAVSREWLVLCYPAVLITCLLEREAVRTGFRRMRRHGHSLRPVVLVGANAEAEMFCDQVDNDAWLGYRIVGVVDDGDAQELRGRRVYGRTEDTLDAVQETGATGVIIATTAVSAAVTNRLARQLVEAGLHVELSSSLQDITAERLTVRALGRCPVVYVEPVRRDGWRAVAKRMFDVIASTVTLIVILPFLAVIAIAIKLDSDGPVLFSQVRAGRDGEEFEVVKFRTMVDGADEMLIDLRSLNEVDGPLFKLRDDPRVTRVGRVLRRYSLDELPQLWNVLRGEMSLVGPRPALYSEMDQWSPEVKSRLRVRPGLTGMWQVSGRSDLSFSDYVRYDLYYVDNWSLWRDLVILSKTIPVVLSKDGAY